MEAGQALAGAPQDAAELQRLRRGNMEEQRDLAVPASIGDVEAITEEMSVDSPPEILAIMEAMNRADVGSVPVKRLPINQEAVPAAIQNAGMRNLSLLADMKNKIAVLPPEFLAIPKEDRLASLQQMCPERDWSDYKVVVASPDEWESLNSAYDNMIARLTTEEEASDREEGIVEGPRQEEELD